MCDISELTFLIVDSDERSLTIACDTLRALGVDRLECESDPYEALKLLGNNEDVDVVLVNYKVSGMDGLKFVGRARELCPEKQILLYSDCKKATIYLAALNVGATDYVDSNEHFEENIRDKLPFWIGVAQEQCRIKEVFCD